MYAVVGLVALEYLCSAYDIDSLMVHACFCIEGQAFSDPSVETAGLYSDPGFVQGEQATSSLWENSSTNAAAHLEVVLVFLVCPRGALGASIDKLVQYLPDPLVRVVFSVGIKDVSLKNPSIPAVLAVSMIPCATVSDRVVYVLKHLFGERTLAVASVLRRILQTLLVSPAHLSPSRRLANIQASMLCFLQKFLEAP